MNNIIKELIIGLILFTLLISVFGIVISSDPYKVWAAQKYINKYEDCYFHWNNTICVMGLEKGKKDCLTTIELWNKYRRTLELSDIAACEL